MQIITILGICGPCRCDEIVNTTINDIEQHGKVFCVTIPNDKNKKQKWFTVPPKFYKYMITYMDIRLKSKVPYTKLLLTYSNEKLKNQVN